MYDTNVEHGTAGGGDRDGRGQVKKSRMIHLLGHFTTISWFLLGCHLCSWPESLGAQTPGYRTLAARYTPTQYHGDETMTQLFWLSWGGVLVMMAVVYSPPLRLSSVDERLLQRLFTNRFAAYLGDISYSMYLRHSSVNEIVGMRHMRPAWFAWMEEDRDAASLVRQNQDEAVTILMDVANTRFLTRWALGMFVNTLVLFWVSDLFKRAVDTRSVRFTKKISEWARKEF